MSSSILSAPTLYTRSDLEADPALVTQITNLINDAFHRSKLQDPVKWGKAPQKRFPTIDVYFEMLGLEGIVVLLFEEDAKERKVVAVAAAVPWTGGWQKESTGTEEGWEIKAVAVDGNARYLHRGLAVQVCTFLERHLAHQISQSGVSTIEKKTKRTDQLSFWIQAAECINGPYWRKKGYELVRKKTFESPTWGCQTSFEMVVMMKDVAYGVTPQLPYSS